MSIAELVITADFALSYAGWLEAHLEKWCATTCGELVPETPHHYLRFTPGDPCDPHTSVEGHRDFKMKNRQRRVARAQCGEPRISPARPPRHPRRGQSAHRRLRRRCRRGLETRPPAKPLLAALQSRWLRPEMRWPRIRWRRRWRRVAAAHRRTRPLRIRDRPRPAPFIEAMERFANAGGMLPEQVWHGDDLPNFKRGDPTGSAMSLCWAHAEYMTLVRSLADGAPFDRIAPVHDRYVRHCERASLSQHEMWSCVHRCAKITAGKTLRVITTAPAVIHWSNSGDATAMVRRPSDESSAGGH